jgi:hypothetical protein
VSGGEAGRFHVPRDGLVAALVARAETAEPLLLTGPPGAGKTTLLCRASEALAARGWRPVYLDLLAAASTPERFVTAVLQALPAEGYGPRLSEAVAIRRLAEGGRLRGCDAVQALFELLAAADETGGRRVALLLDEATEIRSLAYFPGLRHADQLLGAALRARRGGTLLATSFPTLARRLWRFAELEVGPLPPGELGAAVARAAAHLDPAALARAAFGWARYVRVLLEESARGADLETAWTAAMLPGGRLEQACRATYETLLLRSRGYGACKAALAAVAYEEGLNLTALVARLGRTAGATRDYLHWLVGVDALRMERKRYAYVDGLLRLWVRLHAGGTLPDEDGLRECYAALAAIPEVAASRPAATPAKAPAASADAVESEAAEPAPQRPRRDALMEID